jgi:putative tryptophan/tyrosine transport system substrate-binding protein
LVAARADVIVTYATGVAAAARATSTVPIVQATGGDPVALGYAVSLARPGKNVAGSPFFYAELMAKRLELLKELCPAMGRALVLLPKNAFTANGPVLEALQPAAKALAVELQIAEIGGPAEFEAAVATGVAWQAEGILISDNDLFVNEVNARVLAEIAIRHRLPSIGAAQTWRSGALMAYGVNFEEQFRRAPFFVDKILKGAKPATLPFEQATTFQFQVNLKTARALGMTIAPTLLARADEVIE